MKKYSRRVAIVQTGWKTQIVCSPTDLPSSYLSLPFFYALPCCRVQPLHPPRGAPPTPLRRTRKANVTRSWASWLCASWALASCYSSSQRSPERRWFEVGILAALMGVGACAWYMICLGYIHTLGINDNDVFGLIP